QILAVYPDAAANPLPTIFGGPVAFDGATRELVSLSGTEPSQAAMNTGRQDVLRLIPLPEDVRHLDAIWRLAADSSPLETWRLWQPTDKGNQYVRCFLLDFGHRVLAAERKRADAGLTASAPASSQRTDTAR